MISASFLKIYLPYTLQPAGNGRYVVANRSYKPLGTVEFADYQTHPATRSIKGLTPACIAEIDYRGHADESGQIWLYKDACLPSLSAAHWAAYQKRLAVLAKLKVE